MEIGCIPPYFLNQCLSLKLDIIQLIHLARLSAQ